MGSKEYLYEGETILHGKGLPEIKSRSVSMFEIVPELCQMKLRVTCHLPVLPVI